MKKKIIAWIKKRVTQSQINTFHKYQAIWANLKYGFPTTGMVVIGVTGTKGKTTTCHMISSILTEAGYKVGMATTASLQIGDQITMNNTNKSVMAPLKLQALIREMKDNHCDVLILEATSIGLDQYRLWGIPFQYVGLTNMAHDHLDYHKNWDSYQKAKMKLFSLKSVKVAVVNMEDPVSPDFIKEAHAKKIVSYSTLETTAMEGATDHIYADKISSGISGATFTLHSEGEHERITLQLPGIFSIENALCASAICLNMNLKIGTIAAGLSNLDHVPGRLEKIETKKGFSILIDYAHTPDSLEKLYSTMRPEIRGRMIAVLGSCGDRDKTKRPIMGALAARFCDYVLVTDEEPYTEDPLAIIEEVAKGVPRGRALYKPSGSVAQKMTRPILKTGDESGENEWWWKINDRKEAIERAILLGKMDDLILITGMGSQNFKIVGDKQVPWNDRLVIEEILEKHNL